MAKLIECIPNFSCSKEKDEATYNALVETAKSVPGCTLFDAQTDGNHNRCVFTLIGSPEAIEEVAFQLTKVATERIDMNKHHGEHKRMGATDVIPFVPQMDVTVEEAVEMSKRVAQRIWDELLSAVKTKRYAYARLRRMLLAAYLDVTAADVPPETPYLRVLACNERGRKLLKTIKKTGSAPVLTKSADVRALSEEAQKLFALTARAADQYVLAYPELRAARGSSAWTEGPVIV